MKVKCSVVIDSEIVGVHTSTIPSFNFKNLSNLLIKHVIRPHLHDEVAVELCDLEDFEPENANPPEAERRVVGLFGHTAKKDVHFFELCTNSNIHMTVVKV